MNKLSSVKGIGKSKCEELAKLGIFTLEDALSFIPRAFDDRRNERRLRDITPDNPSLRCHITVLSHSAFSSKRGQVDKITVSDDNGDHLELLCFNRGYLKNMLALYTTWYISANVQRNHYVYQSATFEIKRSKEELGLGKLVPIYPLAGSLTEKDVRRVVDAALNTLLPLPEPIPLSILERHGLLTTNEALVELHHPRDTRLVALARRSLAFSELLMMMLSLSRERTTKGSNRPSIASPLEREFISSLKFKLTPDQRSAIDEIRADLDSDGVMNRLLEGDVGAGKTLIAWLSALHVISKGGQVAFMAPTELLARQHAEKAAELFKGLGVRLAYVTGDVKGKGRRLLLNALKNGEIDLAIGTHALFSNDVEFKKLSYVIIDEQHRFGVAQKEKLLGKGSDVDLLSMTATPIPRTLALTIFAGMDITTIKTLPLGRLPIKTHLVSEAKRDDMYRAIGVEFKRGHQAYFVYPKIDKGDGELKDVVTMYDYLREKYPNVPSALIHSKLDEDEKLKILTAFRERRLSYLVSTSVVEVGIDIPAATCMVIENADRFGLAALHQLRGRVGRSNLQSYCFLVFNPSSITEDARERMKVMRETTDGFLIAERDLEIRGPGDMLGLRQSGFLKLKYTYPTEDVELMDEAKSEAERILREDKGLIKGENSELRRALETFVLEAN